MRIVAVALAALLLFPSAARAADLVPWADVWTNLGNYGTNGERSNFNSFVLRSEGKFGVHLPTGISNINLSPYLAYYGVYSQDKNYWNNELATGFGLRTYPLANFPGDSWTNEWIKDIKVFVEVLNLSVLQDKATATTNEVRTNDFRVGVDLWHEWNLNEPDPKYPWAEVWGNLSYRDTNFIDKYIPKFKTYLLYLQTKFGAHMAGGVRPYVVSYLTSSSRPEAWYNSWYYGVGVRFEPFREQKDPPEVLRKFKMFVEVLGISWLQNKDSRPANDARFGIDFTYGR